MAGAGEESAMLRSVVIGFTNLVFTMAALAIIDHFGRRRLMLVGSVGYILSLGAAAWAFQAYQTEFQGVTEASQAVAVARTQFHEAAQAAGEEIDTQALAAALAPLNAASDAAVAGAGRGGMVVMVSLLVFIASHAFGQGAVIWVFLSEIFPIGFARGARPWGPSLIGSWPRAYHGPSSPSSRAWVLRGPVSHSPSLRA